MSARRDELQASILTLIAACKDGDRHDAQRDALLLALARHQMDAVAPYARYAAQRLAGRTPSSIVDIPALPTDAFRYARIASRPEQDDIRRFRSSGTTRDTRSLHPFTDLTLYDVAAEAAARYALFPDRPRMPLVVLAPGADELPDSSLSYMLDRFASWFGEGPVHRAWPLGRDEIAQLSARLAEAEHTNTPIALLGTSFAFVHAIDALGEARFTLPSGSRIMQTGGFKGRSRELSPDAMRALLMHVFGIDAPSVIAEYGMTELSSQLYETTVRAPRAPRRLWAPGWVRVSVVHPESLLPLPEGTLGLVRIDDAANLDSVACIQTADLGVLSEHGLTLHGRAADAVARGCSITADQLLSTTR